MSKIMWPDHSLPEAGAGLFSGKPLAILSVANYIFLFGLLQDMKRPFTPMKNLDMGEVISGIIDKIK